MALTDGLVSAYQFASGQELADSVGSGTLSRYGTEGLSDPTFGGSIGGITDLGSAVAFEAAKLGQGAAFAPGTDGGEGLVITTSPLDTSAPFSLAFWAKSSSYLNQWRSLVSANVSDNNNPVYVSWNIDPGDASANFVEFALYGAGDWPVVDIYDMSLLLDTWHLVVAGWDGSQLFMSLDGGAAQTASFSGTNADLAGAVLSLGASIYSVDGSLQPFCINVNAGDLNRVWLWNRALTSDEIAALYNGGAGLDYPFAAAPEGGGNTEMSKNFVVGGTPTGTVIGQGGSAINFTVDGALGIAAADGKAVVIGAPDAAPDDADLANGTIALWLDESGDKLKVKAKYSDGTVKSGEIAIA